MTGARELRMDFSEYLAMRLVKDRLREMQVAAERERLAHQARPRRGLRVSVGTVLIRLGAWLLRQEDPVPGG